MRRLRPPHLGAFLLVLGCGACEIETAAPAPPQGPQVQTAPARRSPTPPEAAALTDARRVRQVIDGDTITVSGIGTVRLIGVDAPEKTGGYREAERYGDEATRFLRELVDGKLVRLEYDGDRKDQYNRTLAYVILEDGTVANEAIIRAGWAETYRRFNYRLKADFQAAEREARAARRGMWTTRK
jgi:micrococcal nuclease